MADAAAPRPPVTDGTVDVSASYPVVIVYWRDCATALPWMTPDDARELADELPKCRTAGFLIEDAPEHLVVVSTLGFREDEEMVHTTSIIPRAQIERVERIRG